MITKEKLQRYIDTFPEEMSIDEPIDTLVFAEKPENRINESKKGEVIDHEELKAEMQKWFE